MLSLKVLKRDLYTATAWYTAVAKREDCTLKVQVFCRLGVSITKTEIWFGIRNIGHRKGCVY